MKGRSHLLAATCAALGLGLTQMGSSARADEPELLCVNSGNSPGNLDEWRVGCVGEYIFADVWFKPIDETKGRVNVHVTSHGACDAGGRHIACQVNNSGSIGCFDEATNPWIDYDGYASGAIVICGCYDEGDDPCN